ncbi:MAG: hypothetical protein AUK44_07645 [Porphyromonadaceae bacterium CG2_30_38_12]|nr:MAG: hypothetical protein AUK44_07645 [Porphyromonadaceae bacterium CG2_30_38_12]
MKYSIIYIILFLFSAFFDAYAQQDSLKNKYKNTAEILLAGNGKLMLGGYGEVHYSQPLSATNRYNGTLDVHRTVMFLGYNFNSRTQFISEFEFEHVNDVLVEQAFLQHRFNKYLNLRAGLLLIPMGIVNEYHEPTTFNGVERPIVDTKIAPSTWREIGVGFSGSVFPASLKYQVYVVNGFSSYKTGVASLSGKDGFRGGRQKGAESFVSSPNFTAKIEYYGIRGLNLGLSGYVGKTQSTLYNALDKNNLAAVSQADSSVVSLAMVGVDARYNLGGLQLRGQYYYSNISNTRQYNAFTHKDLGSAMMGYYVEVGYNLFRFNSNTKSELMPFIRLENYNTHFATTAETTQNMAYNNRVITSGLTYKLTKGAVIKVDMQFLKPQNSNTWSKVFSAGVGVMF